VVVDDAWEGGKEGERDGGRKRVEGGRGSRQDLKKKRQGLSRTMKK
jgi:hypothetical protein